MALSQRIQEIRQRRGIDIPSTAVSVPPTPTPVVPPAPTANNTSTLQAVSGIASNARNMMANQTTPPPAPTTTPRQQVAPITQATPRQPLVTNFGDSGGASTATRNTTGGLMTSTGQAPSFDVSTMSFGNNAINRNQQTPGYMSSRNDFLAQEMLNRGTVTAGEIYDYLGSSYQDFQSESQENKQNTAQAIANRIGEMQAQQQESGQAVSSFMSNLDRITENEIERDTQSYLQDLQRAGQVGLDRPTEDLERQKDLQTKALERSIENTRFAINGQIEDVAREAQMTVNMSEKIGALKGFNASSEYVNGINNIMQDADRTISRLQTQLSMAESATGEAKAELMKDFDLQMKRTKEDFSYQMRSVMDLGKIQMESLVAKYGLDDEKVKDKIDSITLDVLSKRENLISQYINNSRSSIAMVNDQIGVLQNYESLLGQSRERFTAVINMDNGAALSNMSFGELQSFVSQGYLTPEQGAAYGQLMIGKAVNTLGSIGMPTQEDVQTLNTLIRGGMSPTAAIAQIVQNNKQRYSSQEAQKRQYMPGSEGMLRSVDESGNPVFQQAPTRESTQVASLPKNIREVPPAPQDKLSSAFTKYTSIKDGSKVRGGQCGEFVNDYIKEATGIDYNMYTDPIDTRLLQSNSDAPTVGSVVIIDRRVSKSASPLAQKYGHVGIVTSVNPDGTFNYKDQNGSKALAVGTSKNVAVTSDMRFFDPALGLSRTNAKASPQQAQAQEIGIDDIMIFNDPVTRRKMPKEEIKRIGDEKRKIMTNPKADIQDILMWSAGSKPVLAEQSNSFTKYSQAMGKIDGIQGQISKMRTGPILGKLRDIYPYDTDAQVLKAQLTGLIPTIARGVYGEVGVLTDADVRLYAQTLPNLQGTQAKNEGVLAFTLDILAAGYKKQLASLAGQGYDVSGLEGEYMNIKGQADELKAKLGIKSPTQEPQQTNTNLFNQNLFSNSFTQGAGRLGGSQTPIQTTQTRGRFSQQR